MSGHYIGLDRPEYYGQGGTPMYTCKCCHCFKEFFGRHKDIVVCPECEKKAPVRGHKEVLP